MLFTPAPNLQFAKANEIREWQNSALRTHLSYLQAKSPFYREFFAKNKIDIEKIKSINDLHHIPTVGKTDIQNRNTDFFAVPKEQLIDYTSTSGTLGLPVFVPLNENDLQRLAYNEKMSFTTAGLNKNDILQLMLTLDKRFMAGMAYYLGAREAGMGVVRVGSGAPGLQWDTINSVHPTACMVVPTFLLKLLDYAQQQGIDFRKSSLKTAIGIGEGLRKPDMSYTAISEKLHDMWPELKLRSTYASTEMQSSFTECECECGGHEPSDMIICEFIDEDGNPVKDGEAGELCITTLGVEAFPLLRFRTGDICYHFTEPCKCGRNSLRVSPLIGRKSQMIKYKGTTFYPPALFDMLESVPEVVSYIIEVFTNENGTDDICLKIFSEQTDEKTIAKIKDVCRLKLRAVPTLQFCGQDEIDRLRFPVNSRKMVKFVDAR